MTRSRAVPSSAYTRCVETQQIIQSLSYVTWVLLGGLALSTVFTLFVIPALLAFVIGFEKSRVGER